MQDAVRALQRLAQLNPGIQETYYLLGIAYEGLNDYTSAEVALRKSIELNRGHVPSYIAIAGVYKNLGQHEAALAAFEAAAKANPGNTGSARGKLFTK